MKIFKTEFEIVSCKILDNKVITRVEYLLQGIGELLDGIVTICSLGFLFSNFEIEICKWRTLRAIQRKKKFKSR